MHPSMLWNLESCSSVPGRPTSGSPSIRTRLNWSLSEVFVFWTSNLDPPCIILDTQFEIWSIWTVFAWFCLFCWKVTHLCWWWKGPGCDSTLNSVYVRPFLSVGCVGTGMGSEFGFCMLHSFWLFCCGRFVWLKKLDNWAHHQWHRGTFPSFPLETETNRGLNLGAELKETSIPFDCKSNQYSRFVAANKAGHHQTVVKLITETKPEILAGLRTGRGQKAGWLKVITRVISSNYSSGRIFWCTDHSWQRIC